VKGNRLTKEDLRVIRNELGRIKELASLENAMFCFDKEEDENVKKQIRPYMMWFDIAVDKMEEILKED
jgi:hypothetical protein